MFKLSAMALLFLFTPACFLSRGTVNQPLESARIDGLQPGKSTAGDVANALGAPTDVVQLGKRMAWRYDFSVAKTAGFSVVVVSFLNEDTRVDRAWLFFDENSVLQYASRTLEAKNSEYAMPWENVHEGH